METQQQCAVRKEVSAFGKPARKSCLQAGTIEARSFNERRVVEEAHAARIRTVEDADRVERGPGDLEGVSKLAVGDEICEEWIERSIEEIRRDFLKPELEAVMETVGPGGELIDHFDGRTLNPGHAIEAAWFILAEAKHRGNDPELIELLKKKLNLVI